jgi:hypothetical protein
MLLLMGVYQRLIKETLWLRKYIDIDVFVYEYIYAYKMFINIIVYEHTFIYICVHTCIYIYVSVYRRSTKEILWLRKCYLLKTKISRIIL